MPYAANNQISRSVFDGGIEITAEEYKSGVSGMARGKVVTMFGGSFGVESTPAAYAYCEDTGEYQFVATALLKSGGWAAPDGSTLLTPPRPDDNEVAVFSNGEWSIVKDYRGETWWSAYASPELIIVLGDPTENGLTQGEPNPPPPSTNPADYNLTARQLRLGLVRHDISLASVEAAINGISDQMQRDEAMIFWGHSTSIHWSHPMTQTLMALVGITTENATNMWMVAKDY